MAKKVAVLMGGNSSERSISLATGDACLKALLELGYEAFALDVSGDFNKLIAVLSKVDIVFNALHGFFGEDGKIQAILEFLQIPYTHSGVLASALAMDKAKAKIVAKAAGVATAPSVVINRFDIKNNEYIDFPYVIKPLLEGSSVGVHIVKDKDAKALTYLTSDDWKFGDEVLLEAYVKGREFACGVMGDEALAVTEICIDANYEFYDINAKYQPNGSNHICPADLSLNIYQNMQRMALLAHQAIGCKGVSRSDFRYDEKTNKLAWLEINTQPGMTVTSLLPEMAAFDGIRFNDLVQWITEDASCQR